MAHPSLTAQLCSCFTPHLPCRRPHRCQRSREGALGQGRVPGTASQLGGNSQLQDDPQCPITARWDPRPAGGRVGTPSTHGGGSAAACPRVSHGKEEARAALTAALRSRQRASGSGTRPGSLSCPLHCDSAKHWGGGPDDDGWARRKQRGPAGRCTARGRAEGSAEQDGKPRPVGSHSHG